MTAFRDLRRLDDPAALRAWLYRVTRGHSVDHVRRDVARASVERVLGEDVEEVALRSEEPRAGCGGRRRAVAPPGSGTLDVRHREVLVLHFLEDLPVDEVAAVVGCPGTVKCASITPSER